MKTSKNDVEKCPNCGREHVRGEYKLHPDRRYAPDDVDCPCGTRLRWVVPIFRTTPSGYKLVPVEEDR